MSTTSKICPVCNIVFADPKHPNKIYCSRICRGMAQRTQIERSCLSCGKVFSVEPNVIAKGNGKYCSKQCADGERVTIQCKSCGKGFKIIPANVGRVKYCSRQCRLKRTIVHCQTCGVQFEVSPSRTLKKYCSLKCRVVAVSEARKIERVQCVCKNCGDIFFVLPSGIKEGLGKYCSEQCQHEGIDRKIQINCPICGKQLFRRPSQIRADKIFCNATCGFESRRIKNSAENSVMWRGGTSQRRGANWKIQRELARDRDGGVCQICHHKPKYGDKKNAVHHIRPYREFNGDYIAANDLYNLVTLCHHCHPKAEHGKIPVPVHLL